MFIDTPISSKINSRIFSLGAEYCGNFQTAAANSLALLDEGKIILNLNPKACCETNALTLHSMIGKADCDLVVSLVRFYLFFCKEFYRGFLVGHFFK
jgi:hypothetical protein